MCVYLIACCIVLIWLTCISLFMPSIYFLLPIYSNARTYRTMHAYCMTRTLFKLSWSLIFVNWLTIINISAASCMCNMDHLAVLAIYVYFIYRELVISLKQFVWAAMTACTAFNTFTQEQVKHISDWGDNQHSSYTTGRRLQSLTILPNSYRRKWMLTGSIMQIACGYTRK